MTLRHALTGTPLRVVELAPPAVQTALAGATHGAPLEEFSDAVFALLHRGQADFIGFGPTGSSEFRNMLEIAKPFFKTSAARFQVATYSGSS